MTDKLLWQCGWGQIAAGEEVLSLNNKRLLLEERLDKVPGVQFISTISGHTAKNGSATFWIGCFVAYDKSDSSVGKLLSNFMHDVGLHIMPAMMNRKSVAEMVGWIAKDHKNASVKVSYLLSTRVNREGLIVLIGCKAVSTLTWFNLFIFRITLYAVTLSRWRLKLVASAIATLR